MPTRVRRRRGQTAHALRRALGIGVCSGLCVLAGGAGAGCNIVGIAGPIAKAIDDAGTTVFPAQYTGLEGKTFAVMVEADAVMRVNSPRIVNVVTNGVTRQLSQNVIHAGFVPGPRVLEFQFSTPRSQMWEPLRIADELTVDRLVKIELVEYRLNEPGNATIWEGRAIARVEVYEAELEGNEPVYTQEVRVAFPDGTGFSRQEIPGRAVEANLQQRLIDRISWLMYEVELPNTLPY